LLVVKKKKKKKKKREEEEEQKMRANQFGRLDRMNPTTLHQVWMHHLSAR
jgi:hypothetical protein